MRILIPFIILSCIVCCRTKELRIPDQPGLSHLASPVFLKSDTTWVDLKDYFLYPEKIKKITPLAGVKLYWDKTASTLGVIAGDSGVLLSGMNIRYEGYDYQIPVMRPNPDAGFYIGTDDVRGDTFFLQSTSPVIDWAVYFQNYKLAENFLSCPGNGAAELIKYLVDELTGCLGVVYPTFEEYPNRMQEDKVIAYVPQNKDFSYTADDLMAFFAVREVAAILLINPDNPSGNYISKVDVVHLAKWCKDKKVTLVVDESFVDFSEQSVDNTLLTNEILEENPNLVVVKSISKSYGVPGLRLGILASSNLLLIDRVRKNVPIWNINSFAEFYMQIFNKYEQDYKQACRLFIRERDRFYVDLQQIGYLRVIPSQANYFLCEVISKYSSKELTELLLNEYNILIKDCGTKKAFRNGEYIRIAVRSTLDNQRLIDALKEL